MEQFIFYVKIGLEHVLDLGAYDHILFLAALTIPFTFKQLKSVIWLATLFTVGHTISLFLSVFKILTFDPIVIEFLIPVTIFLTALYNFIQAFKNENETKFNLNMLAAFFFGLVHGFGFSNYFKMIIAEAEEKVGPLISFAVGIELSQLIIVVLVLILATLALNIIKIKRQNWIMASALIVMAITIPMLIDTYPA